MWTILSANTCTAPPGADTACNSCAAPLIIESPARITCLVETKASTASETHASTKFPVESTTSDKVRSAGPLRIVGIFGIARISLSENFIFVLVSMWARYAQWPRTCTTSFSDPSDIVSVAKISSTIPRATSMFGMSSPIILSALTLRSWGTVRACLANSLTMAIPLGARIPSEMALRAPWPASCRVTTRHWTTETACTRSAELTRDRTSPTAESGRASKYAPIDPSGMQPRTISSHIAFQASGSFVVRHVSINST